MGGRRLAPVLTRGERPSQPWGGSCPLAQPGRGAALILLCPISRGEVGRDRGRDPTMNKSGGCDEEWWQARRPWSTSATSENEQFKVDIPGNLFREVNPTVFCRA